MVAWINRFMSNLRVKRSENRCYDKSLSCDELIIAERKLLKLVQQEMFSDELVD